MDLRIFCYQIIIALIMGMIYALMGVGLTLIYGVMKIFNLSHGEFYMLGGYLVYVFSMLFELPMIISLILSAIIVFISSSIIEKILIHEVSIIKGKSDSENAIIVTLGLSMILVHSSLLIFGPLPLSTPDYMSGIYSIGDLSISGNRLFAFGITILMFIALFLFLKKTWTGRALQAVAQSKVGASVVGIDISKFNNLAFAISSMLAAISGALLAPIFYLTPTSGGLPLTKGWIIIILGGMGSVTGSLFGGLILGIVEVLGVLFLGPEYRNVTGFIALVIILVVKPSGIFGEKVRKA